MNAVPGWHQDPAGSGRLRWWDGSVWTEHFHDATTPPAAIGDPAATVDHGDVQIAAAPYGTPPTGPAPHDPTDPAAAGRRWYQKKRVIIPGAVLLAFVAIGALSGGGDDEDRPAARATQSVEPEEKSAAELAADEQAEAERQAQEEAEAAAKAEEERLAEEKRAADEAAAAEAAAAEAARVGTVSQQNAYASAKSYLDFKGFSRAGIIEQLTSEYGEGFPPADAEFAIARLEAEGGVDWNAEAAQAAQSYLEFKAFSRQGLIEQLTSEYGEGFTREQAEYGVSTTGL